MRELLFPFTGDPALSGSAYAIPGGERVGFGSDLMATNQKLHLVVNAFLCGCRGLPLYVAGVRVRQDDVMDWLFLLPVLVVGSGLECEVAEVDGEVSVTGWAVHAITASKERTLDRAMLAAARCTTAGEIYLDPLVNKMFMRLRDSGLSDALCDDFDWRVATRGLP